MTAVRTTLRPSRRSLLLSGALLGSLGVVGCDRDEKEEKPRPRATVAFEQMTTSEDLRTDDPMRDGTWSVSPTTTHEMAMIVSRVRGAERELFALTLESSAGTRIPIDPATTTVSVDRHGGVVQVLAEKPVEDERHHVLWKSEDLVDWTETDLGNGLGRLVEAFGDGIVVGDAKPGGVPVWGIHGDGEITALTPVPVPDGQQWQIADVAHTGKTIVILLRVYDGAEDWMPRLVVSDDGGESWGEAMELPGKGEDPEANSVRALEKTFVILGGHDVAVDWDEEWKQTRPVAWSFVPGEEIVQEEIPLPLFGVDGWHNDVHDHLDRNTPVDYVDLSSSAPIADVAAGEIHCAIAFDDDCRRATRSKDGRWSVSSLDGWAPFKIDAATVSSAGQILLSTTRAAVHRGGSEEYKMGMSFARDRTYARGGPVVGNGVDAVLQESWAEFLRDDDGTSRQPKYANVGVSIAGAELELAEGFPEEATTWPHTEVHHLPDGAQLLTAVVRDEEGNAHLEARLSTDGDWSEVTLLEEDGVRSVGHLSEVDGVTYLPVDGGVDEKENLHGTAVLASSDGIAWETKGSVDPAAAKEDGFAGGAYVTDVVSVGEEIIAIGRAYDEDAVPYAATFQFEGDLWIPRLVPDFPAYSWLDTARVEGERVLVDGVSAARVFTGVLAEDGSISQISDHSGYEQRDLHIDLGDGVLLASGWIDRSSGEAEGTEQTGHGACIWASPDDGTTWTATVLPGQECRFPSVDLARDGEDVVAVSWLGDAPAACRIVDAKAQVLAALE